MIYRHQAYHFSAPILIIFSVICFCILAGGYLYYDSEKRHTRAQAEKELAAIAELKVREIEDWRRERIEDAEAILRNPFFAGYVKEFLSYPSSPADKDNIYSWLKSFRISDQYNAVLLVDIEKKVRLSVHKENTHKENTYIDKFHAGAVDEAMQKKTVTFVDFHKDGEGGPVNLDMLIPILVPYGNEALSVGVVIIRIDPNVSLYPMIQTWPTPSSSGETLLIHREGNDVVYLNELRYKKNTALLLRYPVSERKLPAAMAARGNEGIVEGKDYRGVSVLAAIKTIPGSPWFLVAKVDFDEVYAPVRKRLWTIVLFVSALIVLAGTIIGYIWLNQQARVYRIANQALQAEIKEREQAEKLLEERTRMLEFANKELESFSYSISHDLRTPLRAIDGYSRMILKKQGDKFDEDTSSKFNFIRSNIRMMGKLIDDLLSFSRFGRTEINMSHIDMKRLIEDVWNELQIVNRDRAPVLTVNDIFPCSGDRTLIRQVYFESPVQCRQIYRKCGGCSYRGRSIC